MCCSLDTLAQLSTRSKNVALCSNVKSADKTRKLFVDRQKSKALSNAIIFKLVDLDSPLTKAYWSTYHCNKYLFQNGRKVTAKYCNQRWCVTCSRIRAAKMINGYLPELEKFDKSYFLTLTAPNVKGDYLRSEIERFNVLWRKIYKNIKKNRPDLSLKGIRKIEVSYNGKRDDYNPHFHVILDSSETANEIKRQWLMQIPLASEDAQNIKEADSNTLLELVKYATKQVYDDNILSEPLDVIYQALYKKRLYQPFGIKKYVEEDVSGIQSNEITFRDNETEVWVWQDEIYLWSNAKGEDNFTRYLIGGKLRKLVDRNENEVGRSFDMKPNLELLNLF